RAGRVHPSSSDSTSLNRTGTIAELAPAQALGKLGRVPRVTSELHRGMFVIASRMTRLLVAALVAGVFVTVDVGSQTASAAASTRQLALGVSEAQWDDLSAVEAFKSSVGRYPATWTIWNDWGGPDNLFPTVNHPALMKRLALRDVVPLVFWQPVDPTVENQ